MMLNERYLSNTHGLPTSATFTLNQVPNHLRYVCHAGGCTMRATIELNGQFLCYYHTDLLVREAVNHLLKLAAAHSPHEEKIEGGVKDAV